MPRVEVACQLDGSVRPIRFWWEGERLTIREWEIRRAGATFWDGEVRTLDGRRFRMTFSRPAGGWRIIPLAENPARRNDEPRTADADPPRGGVAALSSKVSPGFPAKRLPNPEALDRVLGGSGSVARNPIAPFRPLGGGMATPFRPPTRWARAKRSRYLTVVGEVRMGQPPDLRIGAGERRSSTPAAPWPEGAGRRRDGPSAPRPAGPRTRWRCCGPSPWGEETVIPRWAKECCAPGVTGRVSWHPREHGFRPGREPGARLE